jgi:nucleotide-binding universal stress UspA family protein
MALAAAGPLAEAFNATVTILGVTGKRKNAQKLREALDQRRQERGLTAEVEVREGEPKEQIVLEESDLRYDFALLGEQRRWLRSRRLRSTPEVLLERAVTPFFVVKGAAPFSSILICTAAGEQSQADIRVGGWIARRLGIPVTLLHVTVGTDEAPSWARSHLDREYRRSRALEVESQIRIRRGDTPARRHSRAGVRRTARPGRDRWRFGWSLAVVLRRRRRSLLPADPQRSPVTVRRSPGSLVETEPYE